MDYLYLDAPTVKFVGGLLEDGVLNPHPLMLYGTPTSGLLHNVLTLIREVNCIGPEKYTPFQSAKGVELEQGTKYDNPCMCNSCQKIESHTLNDLYLLDGSESISDIRSVITKINTTTPKESKYNYLVLANIHRFSKEQSDVLLATVEAPRENTRIFATAYSEDVVPALKSRFYLKNVSPIRYSVAEKMFDGDPRFTIYLGLQESWVRTLNQAFLYKEFGFADMRNQILKVGGVDDLKKLSESLLNRFSKDGSKHTKEYVLSQFLEYYVYKAKGSYTAQKYTHLYKTGLATLMARYASSLFQYINKRVSTSHITIQAQLTGFLFCEYSLRKYLGL